MRIRQAGKTSREKLAVRAAGSLGATDIAFGGSRRVRCASERSQSEIPGACKGPKLEFDYQILMIERMRFWRERRWRKFLGIYLGGRVPSMAGDMLLKHIIQRIAKNNESRFFGGEVYE
jgi:hypothetical protein